MWSGTDTQHNSGMWSVTISMNLIQIHSLQESICTELVGGANSGQCPFPHHQHTCSWFQGSCLRDGQK